MTNLQLLETRNILGKSVAAYGDMENPLFLAKDVADWIGIQNTSQMIEPIDDDEKTKVFLPSIHCIEGLQSHTEYWFLTENGLYEALFLSRKPLAKEFKKGVKQMLHDLRTSKKSLPSQFESLQTRLQRAEQKLQLFEEYNEDILYDFDQVAAAMRIYRKPPFGASHLKKWLADKKIICSAHYKNDKPIQRYIDADWFRLVMHEWKRRGQRRYEPRFLITQRGFNSMIDMAIRERIISLPLPKYNCLPLESGDNDTAAFLSRKENLQ